MSEDTVTLLAAAKINLSLDILGKREDGYHLMQMVMQSVSLYDTIVVTTGYTPGITLTCQQPGVPSDARNIAWKAAQLFYQSIGKTPSLHIAITKQIPSEAGLAGGSADGAAVLLGLNRLFGNPLTQQQLCHLGLQIGADLPFCIVGGTQLVEGIGEKLTPLPPLTKGWFVIAKPPQGVATGPCFQRFDQLVPQTVFHPNTDEMLKALDRQEFPGVARQMQNVLERAAQCPAVERLRQQMEQCGALGCCMTGSGSAVVAAFDQEEQARHCLSQIAPPVRSFLVQPVEKGVFLQRGDSMISVF